MTTDAEREQAERRRVLARAYATTFGVGDGPTVLADLQAHVAGSPGLKAQGAPTSAEYTYRTGHYDGARDLVERMVELTDEGLRGLAVPATGRQTEATDA